jgi:glycogen operon protein
LRHHHPVLRRRRFFQGRSIRGVGVKALAWFDPAGHEMTDEVWAASHVRCLGVRLAGDAIDERNERGERVDDDTLAVLLNAHDVTVPFTLPATQPDAWWITLIDTARPHHEQRRLLGGDQYILAARSVVLLRLGRARALTSSNHPNEWA